MALKRMSIYFVSVSFLVSQNAKGSSKMSLGDTKVIMTGQN